MNILEIILSYHKTLLDLIILDEQSNMEYTECIGASCYVNKVCGNKWGTTRCFTTTDLFLDKYLFYEKILKDTCDNFDKKNITKEKIKFIINTYNLIKINIRPDHIFYIYKTNSSWFLLSSWMKFYNFNIMKIEDIMEFMLYLYTFFVINDKKDVEMYQFFLQKYFFYKFSIDKDSLFITKDIKTLYYSMNTLGDNFIGDDYFGKETSRKKKEHKIMFKCYNINDSNIIDNFKIIIIQFYEQYFKGNNGMDDPDSVDIMKYYLDEDYYMNAMINMTNNINYHLEEDNLLKLKKDNKIKYHTIIEKYSVVLENLRYLYSIVNDKTLTLTINEPSTGINDMNDMNKIIIHYGSKLLDLIKGNKERFGFLTGGYYDISKFTGNVIENNKGNPNNLYFNNYSLIKGALISSIVDTPIKKEYFTYKQFNDFCNDKVELDRILTVSNMVVYIGKRTYLISKKKINISEDNNNVIFILCEVDNKLIEIVTNIDYIVDNLFTCYKLYNINLYITNYIKDGFISLHYVNIKENEYIIIKGKITDKINLLVGNYSNTNTNKLLLDLYSYKHNNIVGDDILSINNILIYFKFYSNKFFNNKEYLYIPYLDKEYMYDVFIKHIYINFVKYNYIYTKYILKLEKMLTVEPTISKNQKNNMTILIRQLNNDATTGLVKTIFNTHNPKINFLLLTYNTIKRYLASHGYKEYTDYILVFKGGMALNILIQLKYPKLIKLFTEGDYDFAIYINTRVHSTRSEINILKMKIYDVMCLIKNKLNLNVSETHKGVYENIILNITNEFNKYIDKKITFYDEYDITNTNNITIDNENKFDIMMKEHNDFFIKENRNIISNKSYLIPNYYFISYNHFSYYKNTLPLKDVKFDLIRIKLNFQVGNLNNTYKNEKKIENFNIKSEILDVSIEEVEFTSEFIAIFNTSLTYNMIFDKYHTQMPDAKPNAAEAMQDITNPLLFTKIVHNFKTESSQDIPLVLLRGTSVSYLEENKDDQITFFTIPYHIIELYKILLQQPIFPWLAPKYDKKLDRFLSLIYYIDNNLITKIVKNVLNFKQLTDSYKIDIMPTVAVTDFYDFDKTTLECYDIYNTNVENCVDCFIDKMKIFFKIARSSEEVYNIIYNNYYIATCNNIKQNYSFAMWKSDFKDFIRSLY